MNDKQKNISFRIFKNRILNKIQDDIREEYCLCCGKKMEKEAYCRSHSFPKSYLKNISDNGEIYSWNVTQNTFIQYDTIGTKVSGIFRNICRSCDQVIFTTYENEKNYKNGISDQIINEIAYKNSLYRLYKDKIAEKFFESNLNKCDDYIYYEAFHRDVEDDYNKVRLLKNKLEKRKSYFQVSWNKQLPYRVPVAFQGEIYMVVDFEGSMINDLDCYDLGYEICPLYICIFPFKTTTEVIVFAQKTSKRYRKFKKQFMKLEDDDKLHLILYLIILYSDEYYISPKIRDIIFEDEQFKETARIHYPKSLVSMQIKEKMKFVNQIYGLESFKKITNLLSINYKIS